jgi:iron complex transport system ATP-binding protein
MIAVKRVSIERDGRTVLANFSLTAKSGEITALIGPNGSGKSSLIAAIAGDLPVSAGSITIAQQDVTTLPISVQAQLRSVLVQNPVFNLAFTVREIIAMGAQSDAAVDTAISQLALQDLQNEVVTKLSGGQIQRVAIASALAQGSSIFIADEPFAAQDKESVKRIISILKKRAAAGATVLIVAHASKRELQWVNKIIEIR